MNALSKGMADGYWYLVYFFFSMIFLSLLLSAFFCLKLCHLFTGLNSPDMATMINGAYSRAQLILDQSPYV